MFAGLLYSLWATQSHEAASCYPSDLSKNSYVGKDFSFSTVHLDSKSDVAWT
jgi:hypothetical protein